MGKKPIVSFTYENERISIKNSLPCIKCVLRHFHRSIHLFQSNQRLQAIEFHLSHQSFQF